MPSRKANVSVEVTGVQSVGAALDAEVLKFRTRLEAIIQKYGRRVEETAKRFAPVDTGELRDSIHVILMDMAMEVVAEADHAMFVEFGTGRRGASSGGDTPPSYRHGSSAGMVAQPYLRPALEAHRAAFLNEVRGILNA